MARILITGGAGYVGSHFAKALAAVGHHGIVYDSLVLGSREAVRWGPLVVGDVRDSALLETVLLGNKFDAVVHFAALSDVRESVFDPDMYYDVNVEGTRALLHAMRRSGVEHIVFSSSCAVYGEPAAQPVTEAAPLTPISAYGFSKFACGRMMDDFALAYGLNSVRLRYFNAAGADPDGEIGERHDRRSRLIPAVIDAALALGPPVRIFGTDFPTPDGTAVRDYVHVADLAGAHLRAIDYLLSGGQTVAINLGTGHGLSVRDIIAGVERVLRQRVPHIEAPRRPGEPATLIADPGRAHAVLGWKAEMSADAVLADAAAWRLKSLSLAAFGVLAVANDPPPFRSRHDHSWP